MKLPREITLSAIELQHVLELLEELEAVMEADDAGVTDTLLELAAVATEIIRGKIKGATI